MRECKVKDLPNEEDLVAVDLVLAKIRSKGTDYRNVFKTKARLLLYIHCHFAHVTPGQRITGAQFAHSQCRHLGPQIAQQYSAQGYRPVLPAYSAHCKFSLLVIWSHSSCVVSCSAGASNSTRASTTMIFGQKWTRPLPSSAKIARLTMS